MTTPYVDPQTIHNPSPGNRPPAAWGDAVRDDLEFFASGVGVKLAITSSVSIPNNSVTIVSFPVAGEEWDTENFHVGTSLTRITIPAGFGGRYRVWGCAEFAGSSSGNRVCGIYRNGLFYRWGVYTSGAISSICEINDFMSLTVGTYLELAVYQNSGGALNLNQAWLVAQWIGR